MYTKDTYYVKYTNGSEAWLDDEDKIIDPYKYIEVRQMLYPEHDYILFERNVVNGIYANVWLKESSDIEKYDEKPVVIY